jgi:hypothetical protein
MQDSFKDNFFGAGGMYLDPNKYIAQCPKGSKSIGYDAVVVVDDLGSPDGLTCIKSGSD